MNTRKAIAAGLVALTVLTAAPANAGGLSFEFGGGGIQFGFPGNSHRDGGWDRDHRHGGWSRHDFLSTREIRRVLRDHGYRDIDYLDRQGAVYQAQASHNGRRYGLVVSARDGDILNRYRIRFDR